jgi:phasin family protein
MFKSSGQFSELSKGSIESAMRIARISIEGAERLARLQLEAARQFMERDIKNAQAQGEATRPDQAKQTRARIAEAISMSMEYSRKLLYEMVSQTQAELTRLMEEPLANYSKEMARALNEAAKNAPAGTEGDDLSKLIELRMRTRIPPRSPIIEHVRCNAEARDAFIADYGGLFTSAQVAELARSEAGNKAQMAHRWRKEGRIFAVEHRGQTYFPAFQFDHENGRPRPVMRQLIAALAPYHQGWSLALWFAGANAWLGGKRPIDLLERKPEQVLAAARTEMEALDE